MSWIVWWRRKKRDRTDEEQQRRSQEAEAAKTAAEEELRQVQSQANEVNRLVEALRWHREHNHFAEGIDKALRGDQQ
jgi:type VI protein secretion system component VasK